MQYNRGVLLNNDLDMISQNQLQISITNCEGSNRAQEFFLPITNKSCLFSNSFSKSLICSQHKLPIEYIVLCTNYIYHYQNCCSRCLVIQSANSNPSLCADYSKNCKFCNQIHHLASPQSSNIFTMHFEIDELIVDYSISFRKLVIAIDKSLHLIKNVLLQINYNSLKRDYILCLQKLYYNLKNISIEHMTLMGIDVKQFSKELQSSSSDFNYQRNAITFESIHRCMNFLLNEQKQWEDQERQIERYITNQFEGYQNIRKKKTDEDDNSYQNKSDFMYGKGNKSAQDQSGYIIGSQQQEKKSTHEISDPIIVNQSDSNKIMNLSSYQNYNNLILGQNGNWQRPRGEDSTTSVIQNPIQTTRRSVRDVLFMQNSVEMQTNKYINPLLYDYQFTDIFHTSFFTFVNQNPVNWSKKLHQQEEFTPKESDLIHNLHQQIRLLFLERFDRIKSSLITQNKSYLEQMEANNNQTNQRAIDFLMNESMQPKKNLKNTFTLNTLKQSECIQQSNMLNCVSRDVPISPFEEQIVDDLQYNSNFTNYPFQINPQKKEEQIMFFQEKSQNQIQNNLSCENSTIYDHYPQEKDDQILCKQDRQSNQIQSLSLTQFTSQKIQSKFIEVASTFENYENLQQTHTEQAKNSQMRPLGKSEYLNPAFDQETIQILQKNPQQLLLDNSLKNIEIINKNNPSEIQDNPFQIIQQKEQSQKEKQDSKQNINQNNHSQEDQNEKFLNKYTNLKNPCNQLNQDSLIKFNQSEDINKLQQNNNPIINQINGITNSNSSNQDNNNKNKSTCMNQSNSASIFISQNQRKQKEKFSLVDLSCKSIDDVELVHQGKFFKCGNVSYFDFNERYGIFYSMTDICSMYLFDFQKKKVEQQILTREISQKEHNQIIIVKVSKSEIAVWQEERFYEVIIFNIYSRKFYKFRFASIENFQIDESGQNEAEINLFSIFPGSTIGIQLNNRLFKINYKSRKIIRIYYLQISKQQANLHFLQYMQPNHRAIQIQESPIRNTINITNYSNSNNSDQIQLIINGEQQQNSNTFSPTYNYNFNSSASRVLNTSPPFSMQSSQQIIPFIQTPNNTNISNSVDSNEDIDWGFTNPIHSYESDLEQEDVVEQFEDFKVVVNKQNKFGQFEKCAHQINQPNSECAICQRNIKRLSIPRYYLYMRSDQSIWQMNLHNGQMIEWQQNDNSQVVQQRFFPVDENKWFYYKDTVDEQWIIVYNNQLQQGEYLQLKMMEFERPILNKYWPLLNQDNQLVFFDFKTEQFHSRVFDPANLVQQYSQRYQEQIEKLLLDEGRIEEFDKIDNYAFLKTFGNHLVFILSEGDIYYIK